jgi:hypothetical protein
MKRKFSIAGIERCWLRRLVLVVTFVPVMLLGVFLSAGMGLIENMPDLCHGARSCWRK